MDRGDGGAGGGLGSPTFLLPNDFLDKRKIISLSFFTKLQQRAETTPNDKPFTEKLTTPQEYEYLMRYHCIVFVSNVLKIHWRKSYK